MFYRNVNELIKKIQSNLSDDLLHSSYRKQYAGQGVHGHCYVATETLYYLYGKENGYNPRYFRCQDGGTHWWLEKDGEVLDPTAEQVAEDFIYEGKSQFFMCYPSKRCLILAERTKKNR